MTGIFGSTRFAGANGAPVLRSLGKPASRYPGAVATDSDLKIAVDRLQTRLAAPLAAGSTSMTVENASGIVAYVLLSIDSEIVSVTGLPSGNVIPIARGFDGTTPANHLASALVSGFIDAYHHNVLASEIEAIETALGPNLSAIASSLYVSSAAYNFAPQSPAGALIVGANTITLAPVPLGINGTDLEHYVYISGTGTPEAAKIIGGSAVAGAASGQLIIQCANAHPAGWQISSAMEGVPEALSAIAATGGTILVPPGETTARGAVHILTPNITIAGLGWSSVIRAGANAAIVGGIISAHDGSTGFVLRDICIDGNRANNGTNAVTGTQGQWIINVSGSDTTIDRVEVRFSSAIGIFIGSSAVSPTHVAIQNCYIHNNGGVTGPGSVFPTPGGFGVGIFSGGSAGPRALTIRNNRIEENYNTVTSPGDSTGMNLISTENLIEGNYVVNNYNQSGGQISVGTNTGSAGASNTVIRGNILRKPGSFGGDHTTGIEIDSSYVTVMGNTIQNCESGVYIEEQSSYVNVIGNVITGTNSSGAGVYVAGDTPGPSVKHIAINSNMLSGNVFGILVSAQATYVTAANNDISLCSQSFPGTNLILPTSNVEITDNLGFNGNAASQDVSAVTVGASPFVYTAGPRPESIYIQGGTVSAVVKFAGGSSTGINLATVSPTAVRMSPNSQIAIVYTVAPTVIRDIQ